MTDAVGADFTARVGAPWHVWAIGGASSLVAGAVAVTHWRFHTIGAEALRDVGLTEAQTRYYLEMPDWAAVTELAGVTTALIGSLLLLLRSRWAFQAFVVSLAALVIAYVYVLGAAPEGAFGWTGVVRNAAVCAVTLFMLWYARSQTRRGVLR